MNAAEIRSLYVETLARAEFEHVMYARSRYGDYLSPSNARLRWETLAEVERKVWRDTFAERWVTTLAAAGLLPTGVEERTQIIAPLSSSRVRRSKKQRYVTEWTVVSE